MHAMLYSNKFCMKNISFVLKLFYNIKKYLKYSY